MSTGRDRYFPRGHHPSSHLRGRPAADLFDPISANRHDLIASCGGAGVHRVTCSNVSESPDAASKQKRKMNASTPW